MQMIITYLPDKEVTYICLRQIWPFFIKELIIWESKLVSLPTEIKDLSDNPKKLKIALKPFLYSHSFSNLGECFNR
jgi:hypothetical protein